MAKKRRNSSTVKTNTEYKSVLSLLNDRIRRLNQVLARKRFAGDDLSEKSNKAMLIQNLEKMEKLKEQILAKAVNEEINLLNSEIKIIAEEMSENFQTRVVRTQFYSPMEDSINLIDSIKQTMKLKEKEIKDNKKE